MQFNDLMKDAIVVSIYTRKQAISDGVLVDVTDMAKEAGIKYPVALTAARLTEGSILKFRCYFIMGENHKRLIEFKSVCGPGDKGEPVITIMLPWED